MNQASISLEVIWRVQDNLSIKQFVGENGSTKESEWGSEVCAQGCLNNVIVAIKPHS